ncbi:TetR/AcrR family transcriptional regulator [Leifsonia shinshuensis]|uniref:AcrR family transcriptional regulator n=1 Tax=Leifsonia shinshuensis TaxID=150026 RepID=A0A853CS30_9MICO|nr:TetR family transcriptional regulator C-terminal domain-containing protein [Leifsonia shinshuensis]NYJ23487.1 AcrR family transcriptional regulator [Leifsonia shinshuensis]
MTRIAPAARRASLVQAALRVIARDGVAAATTRRIVAEAGMPLASFHYVFASRDELMAELVNTVVAGEQTDLEPALDPATAPLELRAAIRSGLQHYLDGVRADPDREKAMFELTQWALREPGFAPLARRQYDRYYELAERAARDAAELTGSSWRLPVAEVARLLVTLTDGLTIAWLVTRDDAAADRAIDFAADALAAIADVPQPVPAVPSAPVPSVPFALDPNAGAR